MKWKWINNRLWASPDTVYFVQKATDDTWLLRAYESSASLTIAWALQIHLPGAPIEAVLERAELEIALRS